MKKTFLILLLIGFSLSALMTDNEHKDEPKINNQDEQVMVLGLEDLDGPPING